MRPGLPLAPAVRRAPEFGQTSSPVSPTADRQLPPADSGGVRRQTAPDTGSNHQGPAMINPSAFTGLKSATTVAGAAKPPTQIHRAVSPTSPAAAAPELEEPDQVREFQGWEIEFLSSRVFAYLKDKLVVERERHGRPGFTSWP